MKLPQFLQEYFFLFIFQFLGLVSYSQSLAVIQKFKEEPSLDGSPFESAWDKIDAREFYVLNPVSGNQPSQNIEAERDEFFNKEVGTTETGKSALEKLKPVMDELAKLGSSTSKYTDWIVQ